MREESRHLKCSLRFYEKDPGRPEASCNFTRRIPGIRKLPVILQEGYQNNTGKFLNLKRSVDFGSALETTNGQVCGQSSVKLDFFEIMLDKFVSVFEATFLKAFFTEQGSDLEKFSLQVLTDFC